ncbi:MAG: hypothetical protein MUO26_07380 [Methanotrichaceae archaeon]|nr:hypothetical protein [Methanotrichaceae archaeon]
MMTENVIAPDVYMFNDENCQTLNIQIDLPGVNREDIEFRFLGDGFYLVASSADITYKGAYALPAPVDVKKAIGEYLNDLLIINVPYKKDVKMGVRLKID